MKRSDVSNVVRFLRTGALYLFNDRVNNIREIKCKIKFAHFCDHPNRSMVWRWPAFSSTNNVAGKKPFENICIGDTVRKYCKKHRTICTSNRLCHISFMAIEFLRQGWVGDQTGNNQENSFHKKLCSFCWTTTIIKHTESTKGCQALRRYLMTHNPPKSAVA